MDSNFGCKLTTQFDEIIQSIVIVIYEVNLNTCYFLSFACRFTFRIDCHNIAK